MSGISEIRSQAAVNVSIQPPEWLLDCRFVEENAAGLALDTLDDLERIRITHHLSWCPMCAKLVHEMRKTVSYLPFSLPQLTPPPSAKSRLFERIAAEPAPSLASSAASLRTLTIPASAPELGHAGASAETPGSTATLNEAARPSNRRVLSWEAMVAPLAAVPLVLALAIVGGWALHTHNQLNEQVAHSRNLQSANAHLTNEITLLNNAMDGNRTNWYLAAADSSVGGTMGGKLTALGDQGTWAKLSVWNLPAVKDGYQVMLETKEGQMHRAGEFHVDQFGNAELQLDVKGSLDFYRAIHVRPAARNSPAMTNDSIDSQDVLWMDMESNLGAPAGTEANALAH